MLQVEPTWDDFEALIVNNPDWLAIGEHINRFNPIRVMGAASAELRHSSVLAWLLDPKETHGIGEYFLKAFLGEAFRGSRELSPTALDVTMADLRDAEVRREWRNIDIFILSASNGWAFVIENKYRSKQHDGQLTKYKSSAREALEALSNGGPTPSVRGIFLTLSDEAPQDSDFADTNYEAVSEIIDRALRTPTFSMSPEVRIFLAHYLEILQEEVGMSAQRSEMEKVAQALYRQHKKVIDFIVEHGAGSAFALAARDVFGDNPQQLGPPQQIGGSKLRFVGLGNNWLSLLPDEWYALLDGGERRWPGCEKWFAGFPVAMRMDVRPSDDGVKGQLRLLVEVGPLDPPTARAELIEQIKKVAAADNRLRIAFQAGAAGPDRRYSKFLKQNSLQILDVHDTDEIGKKIKDLIEEFAPEFAAVATALQTFVSGAQTS